MDMDKISVVGYSKGEKYRTRISGGHIHCSMK